ncbi:hypothetical protein A2U01_0119403, partial [Trifolium medium]|nr:hypothetical protein [Trifolium medium]
MTLLRKILPPKPPDLGDSGSGKEDEKTKADLRVFIVEGWKEKIGVKGTIGE